MNLSSVFDIFGKILIGLELSFQVFDLFLRTGATLAN